MIGARALGPTSYDLGMTTLARIPRPVLAAGLAFCLAPLSQAQLGQTMRPAGTLDPSEGARFVDITGDGLLDVLVLSQASPGNLRLMLMPAITATEYGLPEPLLQLDGDLELSTYLAADIDADGDMDIWYASRPGPILSEPFEINSYLNDGQGNLSAGGSLTGIGINPTSLESIDVDADGLVDLRISTELASDGFFQRQASGGFASYQRFFTAGHGHGQLELGDVDGDGDPDFVAGNAAVSGTSQLQVVLYMNTGSFPIDPSTGTIVTGSGGDGRVLLSDLDSDGDEDLLVAKSNVATEALLFESLGGAFQGLGAVLPSASFLSSILLTDVDADGDDDILFGRRNLGLRWSENLGGLGFAPELILSTELTVPRDTADLDGDGLKELLLFRSGFGEDILWIRATELQGGAVALGQLEIALSDLPTREEPLAVADVDGDGLEDLVFY